MSDEPADDPGPDAPTDGSPDASSPEGDDECGEATGPADAEPRSTRIATDGGSDDGSSTPDDARGNYHDSDDDGDANAADAGAGIEATATDEDSLETAYGPEQVTKHADGGADTVSGTGTTAGGTASSGTATVEDDGFLDKPPDDEEMPLTEHIEEMLTRLAIVVAAASVVTAIALPFSGDLIIQLWYDVHPGSVVGSSGMAPAYPSAGYDAPVITSCVETPQSAGCVPPHVYGPLEFLLTRLRVAGLAGLIIALPVAVYQTYRFMRPGLYPHERRYYLAAVPFSLVLGVVGVLFAYFIVLPLLFTYFITYTEGSAQLAFQLADTMNLILIMMGMLAVIFQMPLLIMLAIMMGITTRQWLARRRIYFWAAFLGIAFFFGPDPTGMAPVLLTATMVGLFELSLLLLRWTGR